AAQFVEAGDTPDVGADAVVVLQDDRCFAHLPQDGTAAHQLDVLLAFFLGFFQQVHAADNAFFNAFRHRRLGVGFVHHGQVVEDVFLLFHHPARTFANNHRQLVTVGRIIAAAVRDGRGEDVAVPILVLQAFAVQGGAAGGTADQEALGAAVACGPGQITDALEAEHRVEDVERQHGLVVGAVGRGRSDPAGHGARFVDALVEDLAFLVLAVEHHLVLVDRLIQLTDRGIDPQLAEHAFHAEGTCLIGHDRYDALPQLLVLQHLRKNAHEGHGGGDFALAGAVEDGLEGIQGRYRDRPAGRTTLRNIATQRFAARVQVFVFGAAFFRTVEGQVLQLVVTDRDAKGVAEFAQALGIDLLGVVGDVLALAGTGTVTLDGLGQDHAGLTFMVDSGVVGRIDLVGIMAAAVELPDFLVGH